MHCLLFLEFIGTTELLVVMLVALVVFGPRKLPELGRSLGRALSEFQAASDDLKRTWEAEARAEPAAKPEPQS
jgi:TatA/E family protein of Tat protein translocase